MRCCNLIWVQFLQVGKVELTSFYPSSKKVVVDLQVHSVEVANFLEVEKEAVGHEVFVEGFVREMVVVARTGEQGALGEVLLVLLRQMGSAD